MDCWCKIKMSLQWDLDLTNAYITMIFLTSVISKIYGSKLRTSIYCNLIIINEQSYFAGPLALSHIIEVPLQVLFATQFEYKTSERFHLKTLQVQ